MNETNCCGYCGAMIVKTPPHGEFGTQYWVHATTRKKECPSNAHGSKFAVPTNLTEED